MSSLPEEICVEILYKVPAVETLLACKFVCKSWYSLISSPDFVKRHLDLTVQTNKPNLILRGFNDTRIRGKNNAVFTLSHDSLEFLLSDNASLDSAVEIDYPFKPFKYSIKLMGCCDGLVCLWFLGDNKCFFCLWNPATREYKEVPESDIAEVDMVAFGYDNKNNDYKLVVLETHHYQVHDDELATYYEVLDEPLDTEYELLDEPLDTSTLKLIVYSLVSNSWKTIENVPYMFPSKYKQSGVLINGERHWMAERLGGYSDGVIVSLDISNDIFKEIELPEFGFENHQAMHNLGVLDGCLCLFVWGIDTSYVYNIWVMQTYGVRQSWTKRHALTQGLFRMYNTLRLMCSFKSGEILLIGSQMVRFFCMTPKMAVL